MLGTILHALYIFIFLLLFYSILVLSIYIIFIKKLCGLFMFMNMSSKVLHKIKLIYVIFYFYYNIL